MSVSKNFLDLVRLVPETDETGWGAEMNTYLCDLADACDELCMRDGSNNYYLRLQADTNALAASATLTPSSPVHKIQGSGGAVTLSTTTAIANGTKDGQLLVLIGQHDTNTVTIQHNSNVQLNGDVTLRKDEILRLIWDNTLGEWVELNRSA